MHHGGLYIGSVGSCCGCVSLCWAPKERRVCWRSQGNSTSDSMLDISWSLCGESAGISQGECCAVLCVVSCVLMVVCCTCCCRRYRCLGWESSPLTHPTDPSSYSPLTFGEPHRRGQRHQPAFRQHVSCAMGASRRQAVHKPDCFASNRPFCWCVWPTPTMPCSRSA